VPHELAESELFGHEAGGFTGAQGRKRGLLELAEGGTLLLNEIGELSLPLQSKLLTFLDTRSFLRVGGEKAIRVNARLIAATHRDLREEVAKRLFLQPLFYRLAVFCIEVPPLRERKEDIPTLVREIMEQLATEMEMSDMPLIQEDAVNALTQYHWPGNIRELRNVLENALALSEDGTVDWRLLSLSPGDPEWCHKICFPENRTLHQVTDEVMSSLCAEALRRSHGNRKQAAELLGISRYTLYRYLKYYGLEGEKVTQELAAV
jgi:DNA-binding NtrC family response regulator